MERRDRGLWTAACAGLGSGRWLPGRCALRSETGLDWCFWHGRVGRRAGWWPVDGGQGAGGGPGVGRKAARRCRAMGQGVGLQAGRRVLVSALGVGAFAQRAGRWATGRGHRVRAVGGLLLVASWSHREHRCGDTVPCFTAGTCHQHNLRTQRNATMMQLMSTDQAQTQRHPQRAYWYGDRWEDGVPPPCPPPSHP